MIEKNPQMQLLKLQLELETIGGSQEVKKAYMFIALPSSKRGRGGHSPLVNRAAIKTLPPFGVRHANGTQAPHFQFLLLSRSAHLLEPPPQVVHVALELSHGGLQVGISLKAATKGIGTQEYPIEKNILGLKQIRSYKRGFHRRARNACN